MATPLVTSDDAKGRREEDARRREEDVSDAGVGGAWMVGSARGVEVEARRVCRERGELEAR